MSENNKTGNLKCPECGCKKFILDYGRSFEPLKPVDVMQPLQLDGQTTMHFKRIGNYVMCYECWWKLPDQVEQSQTVTITCYPKKNAND